MMRPVITKFGFNVEQGGLMKFMTAIMDHDDDEMQVPHPPSCVNPKPGTTRTRSLPHPLT